MINKNKQIIADLESVLDKKKLITNKWDKQPLKICAVTCNLKRDNLLQEVWND